MKDFFSEYGFDRNVSFISKVELCGIEYPEFESSSDSIECNNYRHEHYDMDIPLISPLYEGMKNVIIDFNGDVTLKSNYSPEEPIIITGTSKVDLNNKKITAPVFAESNGTVSEGNSDSYAFWVKNGGNLTIDGNGEVKSQDARYSMAVWAQGGTVTINNGVFMNGGEGSDLIYASNSGKVIINGGVFKPSKKQDGVIGTLDKFTALNLKNNGADGCSITVYGGIFYGFNPADNLSENPKQSFVAEGYESVKIGEGEGVYEGYGVFEVRKKAE